ncbi:hypothetical protein CR513_38167, partial [Mucuna pruriens]
MYFPPSFSNIMIHLVAHIVKEIRLCGLLFLRWMYPAERYIKILKSYVENSHLPKASIVKSYIAEEAIKFCTGYMSATESIRVPKSHYEGRCEGNGTRGVTVKNMVREEVLQAHLKTPQMNEKWIINKCNNTFLNWFKGQILNDDTISETIKWLALKPNFGVICWSR